MVNLPGLLSVLTFPEENRLSFQFKNSENTPAEHGSFHLDLPTHQLSYQLRTGAFCPLDPQTSPKKDWVLTKEALDCFLTRLDPDRDRAGEKYEAIRLRLLKYFQWCGVVVPDVEVDETLNRVVRKIHEGENVYNLSSYIYGVAKWVYAECLKKQTRNQPISDQEYEIEAPVPEDDDPQVSERRTCLNNCLQTLPEESRLIIVEYYRHEKREKSKHRKELAATRGMTVNALRISAHRLRLNLEACVRQCLSQYA